jgi:hypothetical protein
MKRFGDDCLDDGCLDVFIVQLALLPLELGFPILEGFHHHY